MDLAVVGNGMFGALIDSRGRYVWCCMDTFDGDPVFNCLINNNSDKTGFYDVILDNFERAEQTYENRTAVLVTTLHSNQGDCVEIRDFAPRFRHYDRLFRPFQLFRTIRRLRGDPRLAIRIRPTFQYNSTDGYQTRGSQHVRFCGPTHTWRVTTNTSVRHILEELPFLVPLEPVYVVFGADESFTNSLTHVAVDFELKTISHWKEWCDCLCLPVEFQEVLVRTAVTLAMMQSEDCGGFLASLTLGLPLGPLAAATRDERVCRLLDECLALPVLRDLGLFDVLRKFLLFMKEICFQQEKPQHTYTPSGSTVSRKREWAPYLAGYRGMGEVHSGGPLLEAKLGDVSADGSERPAASSARNDDWYGPTVTYGLLVISLAHAFFDIRLKEELCTAKLFEKLELYALHACDSFGQVSQLYRAHISGLGASPGDEADGQRPRRPKPQPPSGAGFFDDDATFLTWEERSANAAAEPSGLSGESSGGPPAVHSLTSVLCWAAADRLQRIAAHFQGESGRAEYWQRRALEMHEEVCRHAWNPQRGAFTSYWGGEEVGPSMLRIAELGFISADDARFRGTVRAFEADAMHYSPCLGEPNAPGHESAGAEEALHASSTCFITNTLLWYCEALRSTGASSESRRLLESLLKCSAHGGILPESIDIKTSELWGNSPSTPALLSLLRVAMRLSRSWREV